MHTIPLSPQSDSDARVLKTLSDMELPPLNPDSKWDEPLTPKSKISFLDADPHPHSLHLETIFSQIRQQVQQAENQAHFRIDLVQLPENNPGSPSPLAFHYIPSESPPLIAPDFFANEEKIDELDKTQLAQISKQSFAYLKQYQQLDHTYNSDSSSSQQFYELLFNEMKLTFNSELKSKNQEIQALRRKLTCLKNQHVEKEIFLGRIAANKHQVTFIKINSQLKKKLRSAELRYARLLQEYERLAQPVHLPFQNNPVQPSSPDLDKLTQSAKASTGFDFDQLVHLACHMSDASQPEVEKNNLPSPALSSQSNKEAQPALEPAYSLLSMTSQSHEPLQATCTSPVSSTISSQTDPASPVVHPFPNDLPQALPFSIEPVTTSAPTYQVTPTMGPGYYVTPASLMQSSPHPTFITYSNSPYSTSPVKPARKKQRSSYSKWTPEEDELLKKAVQKNGGKNWDVIAKSVPGRTYHQCRQRWIKVLGQPRLKPSKRPTPPLDSFDLSTSALGLGPSDF